MDDSLLKNALTMPRGMFEFDPTNKTAIDTKAPWRKRVSREGSGHLSYDSWLRLWKSRTGSEHEQLLLRSLRASLGMAATEPEAASLSTLSDARARRLPADRPTPRADGGLGLSRTSMFSAFHPLGPVALSASIERVAERPRPRPRARPAA